MNRPFFILLLLFLAIFRSAADDMSDIRFRNLQTRDGLSLDQVNCIFKDSHGYVWIGTASGLNRYDGYNFTIFYSKRPDKSALRDNYVTEIREDARGNLWIKGGDTFCVFNPETERFSWNDEEWAREKGLPGEPNWLTIDGNDAWVTCGPKLFVLRDMGKAASIPLPSNDRDLSSVVISHDGTQVLACTRAGRIFIIDKKTGKVLKDVQVPRRNDGNVEFGLFSDPAGLIWLCSTLGADVYDPVADKWLSNSFTRDYPSLRIKCITADKEGQVWIGSDNNGLFILQRDGSYRHLLSNLADNLSLPDNTVTAICNTGDDGMWVGTLKRGLAVYYPGEHKFVNHRVSDVNCIARDPSDFASVWLGTN